MQNDLPVVVTGASGFVGKHLISQLLAKGLHVRGTVRSAAKADKVRATIARVNGVEALDRLELYIADLLSDDGWDAVMQGAGVLHHVATMVFGREPKDPQEVIRPAMEGTQRVLRFAQVAGIKRIIMTSSIATIGYGHGKQTGVIEVDETQWTDIDGLNGSWSYAEGKSRAERFSWEFVAQHGIGLTTIHPGMILGPALDEDASVSLGFVEMCLTGKMPVLPPVGFCIVDVRDVAEMHIAAAENPDSIGQRYLATGPYRSFLQAAAVLSESYPRAKVPNSEAPVWLMRIVGLFDRSVRQISADFECEHHFNGAKGARLMGHDYISPEDALIASAESLIDLGMIDESKVH